MELVVILLVGAVTVGICFLLDKVFTKAFRSQKQHKSGLSVRLSQHYGGGGIVLILLGLMGIFRGGESTMLLICGIIAGLLGAGLIVYYLSFGIYYDAESFLLTTFGKKGAEYAYGDILGQKLYRVSGGSILVELYLKDGRTVSVQTTMKGMDTFLNTAFDGWCRQTGQTPEECPFHDTANSCWFPSMEE